MPPSLYTNLQDLNYTQYLIIISVMWVILFVLWLQCLIWNIKVHKLNDQLQNQLSQSRKESEQPQANVLSSPETDCQSSLSHAENDEVDEHNGFLD